MIVVGAEQAQRREKCETMAPYWASLFLLRWSPTGLVRFAMEQRSRPPSASQNRTAKRLPLATGIIKPIPLVTVNAGTLARRPRLRNRRPLQS
jgi:hypothetical protein